MAETFKSIGNGKFKVNCIAVIQFSLFKNISFFGSDTKLYISEYTNLRLLYSLLLFLIRVNILCYVEQK